MKTDLKKCLLFSVIYIQIGLSAQNVNHKAVLSNIKSMEAAWDSYYTSSIKDPVFQLSLSEATGLLSTGKNPWKEKYIREMDTYLSVLNKSARLNTGLEFSGSYLNNHKVASNDDAADAFFRSRFQVGLNWNILKGGLVEGKNDLYAENQKILIKKILTEFTPELENNLPKLDTLKAIFNEEKIKWLELKDRCIKAQINPYISLTAEYSTMKISLLKLIARSLQTEIELANCREYNTYINHTEKSSYVNVSLPSFRIKPDFILQAKEWSEKVNDRCKDSILNITRNIMKNENNLASQIHLQTFLRYNYLEGYLNPSLANNFLSAGVSFACPLFVSYKRTERLNEEKVQLLKSEMEYSNTSHAAQYHSLLNTYADYKEKEAQYQELQEQEGISKYKLELQQVKNEKYNYLFSPVEALEELNHFFDLRLKMVDVKYEIYSLLFKIQLTNPAMCLDEYLDTTTYSHNISRRNGNKTKEMNSVYVWSSFMNNRSESEILPFLKANGFNEVILSVKQNSTYLEQLKRIINVLVSNSISVQLMISDNNLLELSSDKDCLKQFEAFLWQVKSNVKAIHLDIEPHVLADWKLKKKMYESAYLNILRQAKKISTSCRLELNVSIPVFYEESFLKEIYSNCNYVYLMAYETRDLERIKQKLNEELKIDRKKSIVSIRANDFNSLKEMVLFSSDLKEYLDIERIAFHDLSRIMKYKD